MLVKSLSRGGLVVLFLMVAVGTVGCGGNSRKPPRSRLEEDPQHHYMWANEQFRRGYYLEALEAINKAIGLDPDKYEYFNMRGLIYRNAGELDKALTDFQKVLELNPYYTDAHNNLGATYAELGQTEAALAEFEKVLKDPNYRSREKAYFNVGDLLAAQGRYRDSIEKYRKAIAIRPDYSRAYFKLGKAHEALGEREAARRAFSEVVRIAPHSEEGREARNILDSDGASS
ncbi:MAG: tetratricopeptide repeat protein [Acidobacteriota bacterium]